MQGEGEEKPSRGAGAEWGEPRGKAGSRGDNKGLLTCHVPEEWQRTSWEGTRAASKRAPAPRGKATRRAQPETSLHLIPSNQYNQVSLRRNAGTAHPASGTGQANERPTPQSQETLPASG